jgi:uncharacterized protein (TIGR02302 family)
MAFENGRDPRLKSLRWPLWLTHLGLFAERLLRAFWPFVSVVMIALGTLMLGLHDVLPIEAVWTGATLTTLAGLAALGWGLWTFRMPHVGDALDRLDATLPGRPLQALLDEQAIGAQDPQSAALWRAHQARMMARAQDARPAKPDLRIARADPFALRYVALLCLAVGLVFGSIWRVSSVTELTPQAAPLSGPSWEGWVSPPRYTGLPTLYLNDLSDAELVLPENSDVTLRFYGEVGALTLAETVSGRTGELPSAADPNQAFTIAQAGELRIDGPGGRSWAIDVLEDLAPRVEVAGEAEADSSGIMQLPFRAQDDYAIVAGRARITLDLEAVDRRFGLVVDPDPRPAIEVDLPMPISGDRSDFTEALIEDFSEHPWAHLPVRVELTVEDATGQTGLSLPYGTELPARRFFDPLAAAVIEQRRDLLWARANARRVAQVLRAISHRPEEVFRSHTAYLRLRTILRRLETYTRYGALSVEAQEEIAQALWDLALKLEDGDIGDALERMRRAQERLSQAMRNGASDQEIAELMQQLRDATQDYLRQLSRQAQQDNQDGQQQQNGSRQDDGMQMTQDDLQRMMDRIQELMEQGRMAEAEQALQELQELMENMRVTRNGEGQNGQNPGQQAMEGLAETLREQQGLSDQAFRDLQEQFNPGAQAGENQGNQGRNGGLGQGQSHQGQGGRGEGGNAEGNQGQGEGSEGAPGLAERQRALRDELRRQAQGLPGAGTEEGDAARDALDQAGRAMEQAEQALRENDLAGAIDEQARAMEALREGMRSLGEAMAQERDGQGTQEGTAQNQLRDPLDREARQSGRGASLNGERIGVDGEDIYRRARDLLDEIRRRSEDPDRSDTERGYLRRLLDRF